jgi:hypothetical protein
MQLNTFLDNLQTSPESIEFQDTMAVIDKAYVYTPASFTNRSLVNQAGENEGSCKLFAFAKLNNLDEEKTLACFGAYYREDVLQNPDSDSHQNIRNFMKTGWAGITFDNDVLASK